MGEGPIARSRLKRLRPYIATVAVIALGAGAAVAATASSATAQNGFKGYHTPATVSASLYRHTDTATPIKHVVVIFDENVSFDHYFGTYPYAANTDGTPFTAKPGTQQVNGLYSTITSTNGPIGPLLTGNPN